MTIVPADILDKDPRNLPYHFKSMSIVAYYKASAKYYFWRLVKTIEDAAKQNGKILVPSECLHWRKKKALKDFHITVFKKGFYQVRITELSENEKREYLSLASNEYTEI